MSRPGPAVPASAAHPGQRAAHQRRPFAEGHPQFADDPAVADPDGGFRGSRLREDAFGVLQKDPAGRGDDDLVAAAPEHGGFRRPFQRRNLLRHRRSGVAEFGGRHGPQCEQLVHVEHGSPLP
jgi:hypothetical protein